MHYLYRHAINKILVELPQVFEKVSYELDNQRDRFRLSLESPVDDPLHTLERINKHFALKEPEREAVAWAWRQEAGDTMFHVVNTFTRLLRWMDCQRSPVIGCRGSVVRFWGFLNLKLVNKVAL